MLSKWKFTSASLYRYPYAVFFQYLCQTADTTLHSFLAVLLNAARCEFWWVVCIFSEAVYSAMKSAGKIVGLLKRVNSNILFLPFSWGQRRSDTVPNAAQIEPESMLVCFSKLPHTFLQFLQQGFALSLIKQTCGSEIWWISIFCSYEVWLLDRFLHGLN